MSKKYINDLTAEEVCKLLTYDPITGFFWWKFCSDMSPSWNGQWGDKEAGVFDTNGYLCITIHRQKLYAHRLAFLIMEGHWPSEFIDHINRDPSDNRWSNLREANYSGNAINSHSAKHNASGAKGVYRCTECDRYKATISVNGKKVHLGMFETLEEARVAYKNAALVAHGDFEPSNID